MFCIRLVGQLLNNTSVCQTRTLLEIIPWNREILNTNKILIDSTAMCEMLQFDKQNP